jgi:hypothetical protein
VGTDIVILKPQPPTVVAELSPIVNMAKSFEVFDQATNGVALERLRALRAGEKRITECFEPSRKAADEAKKEILRLRDGLIGPIAEARGIYDRKPPGWPRRPSGEPRRNEPSWTPSKPKQRATAQQPRPS